MDSSKIKVENPGILEVPEGKSIQDLPVKHFVNLANRIGLAKVTRALVNLIRWNKKKNPELSKWADKMQELVSKKLESAQLKSASPVIEASIKNLIDSEVPEIVTAGIGVWKSSQLKARASFIRNLVTWYKLPREVWIYLPDIIYQATKKAYLILRHNFRHRAADIERAMSEYRWSEDMIVNFLDGNRRNLLLTTEECFIESGLSTADAHRFVNYLISSGIEDDLNGGLFGGADVSANL